MICDLAEPVYWQGRQWAVTAYSVEALSGRYQIPWRDLHDGPARYRLLDQMRHHFWVHMDDLKAALVVSATECRSPGRAA